MSSLIFARGVLTDLLIDTVTTALNGTDLLVGDGIAPTEGGWTGGQPGEGDFKPYVVVSTGPAQKQARDPLARDNTSWLATYTLRHVGALRQQTDWAADTVRATLVDWRPKHIDLGGTWSITQTTYPRLGSIDRMDQSDPPTWELVDQLSVWLEAAAY